MTIGVIISTYNNPQWLEKTLWGYEAQTRPADEIVVADDGSGPETAELIRRFEGVLPIRHVWHEDQGFRKTTILNKALSGIGSDYIVFTDQDCVPRPDFLATHERMAQQGRFLSGGYFKLPMDISRQLTRDDIQSGRAFRLSWLRQQGLERSFKCIKLVGNATFSWLMNHITPTHATWNGMNSSGWRKDLMAANGFDERMQYGGEDRELGERLTNAGIRGKQIRYSAIVLHLDHSRPYVNEEAWRLNNAIRQETKRQHLKRTAYGIVRCLILLMLSCAMPAQTARAQETLRVTEVSGFPNDEAGYALGVSACFAGVIGDVIIMAGGCNFPDSSGVKRYYDGIYAARWRSDTLRWRHIGALPEPVAYGATVALGDRLLLIGGNNSHHSLATVTVIALDDRRKAVLSSLPPLPVTMDNGAAAYAKGQVFVFGGNQGGKPSKALWSLHLNRPKAQWTQRKALPGHPRVQPVGVALGARLFVWGGFHANGDRSRVATDGWAYDLTRDRWTPLASPTDKNGNALTLSGATATALGEASLLCLGGVNKDIFTDAISGRYHLVRQEDYPKQPAAWYRFNPTPLRFDTKKGQWLSLPADTRLARAGAQLVACGDDQYLYIGGELKPGVRTPQILRINLR